MERERRSLTPERRVPSVEDFRRPHGAAYERGGGDSDLDRRWVLAPSDKAQRRGWVTGPERPDPDVLRGPRPPERDFARGVGEALVDPERDEGTVPRVLDADRGNPALSRRRGIAAEHELHLRAGHRTAAGAHDADLPLDRALERHADFDGSRGRRLDLLPLRWGEIARERKHEEMVRPRRDAAHLELPSGVVGDETQRARTAHAFAGAHRTAKSVTGAPSSVTTDSARVASASSTSSRLLSPHAYSPKLLQAS